MSTAPQSPSQDSIYTQTQRCRHAFKTFGLDHALQPSRDDSNRAMKAGERFEKWCWSTGAYLYGLRSLDERLRYASKLRYAVLDCLDGIEEALAIPKQEPSRYPWGTGADTENKPAKDGSRDINDLALRGVLAGFMIQDPITHANGMIDILYRLNNVPGPVISTDRFEFSQGVDLEDGDFFRNEDERYVNSNFPGLNPTLRARLLEASLKRRRMLQYTANCYAWFKITAEQQVGTTAMIKGTGVPTTNHSQPVSAESMAGHVFTEHSLFDLSEQSEADSASDDIMDDKYEYKFPRFPAGNDDGYRICPVCYLSLPLKTEKQWRKHILVDLRPYVCTYPECTFDPDKLYSSQRAWFSHELTFHRRRWLCPLENTVDFGSLEALEAHVRQKHERHLSALSRQAMSAGREIPHDAIENCPLCFSKIGSRKRLESHIGKHFAQIALIAMTTTDAESDDEDPRSENLTVGEEETATHFQVLRALSALLGGKGLMDTQRSSPGNTRVLTGSSAAFPQEQGPVIPICIPSPVKEWRRTMGFSYNSALQQRSWILTPSLSTPFPDHSLHLGQILRSPWDLYGLVPKDRLNLYQSHPKFAVYESTHGGWRMTLPIPLKISSILPNELSAQLSLYADVLSSYMLQPSTGLVKDILSHSEVMEEIKVPGTRRYLGTLKKVYMITGLRVAHETVLRVYGRGESLGTVATSDNQETPFERNRVIIAYSVTEIKSSRSGNLVLKGFEKGDTA